MEPSDDELIGRFRGGESGAFERLIVRWDRRVLGLAYRLTRSVEEARDVRQVAFLRAYQALATFDGRARFSTWIHQVVLNLCRDRARSGDAQDRALARTAERPTLAVPTPAETAERGEVAGAVAAAIAELPRAEREVLVLRHYQGLQFPEIAEILGAPVSTVKSRMASALERLRDRLKDLES
jgi:RNA polymerase sigma-70 factor, ECF subfamily